MLVPAPKLPSEPTRANGSTIVWSRVEKQLVAKERYSQAQAGFMAGQEGIGQVIALRETCLRRRLQNRRTWLLFTDFKTAFRLGDR